MFDPLLELVDSVPKEDLAVGALKHRGVLHAQSPRHTPIHRRLVSSACSVRAFRVNEAVSISYSSSFHGSKHTHASRTRLLISGIM